MPRPAARRTWGISNGSPELAVLLSCLGLIVSLVLAWPVAKGDLQRSLLADEVPVALRVPSPSPSVTPTGSFVPAARAASSAQAVQPASSAPAPGPAVIPDHLFVPAVGINTSVAPKGTQTTRDPSTGADVVAFGVPDDALTVTWWSDGPRPGADDLAILLGHTEIGGSGVFDRLPELRPGTVIGVRGEGRLLRFEVVDVRSGLSKSDPLALRRALDTPPPGAGLALITCSGQVRRDPSSHADNTVVFARLVGNEAASTTG